MKKIAYHIVYALFYLLSLLPYRVLYCLSDLFYLIIYRLVGYRTKVVRRNLEKAFPEKSAQERRKIERDFYHWFCDYFIETVKLLSVSRETLLRHIEFRDAELIEQSFDRGQTCAAILGHYGNWELLSATGLSFKRHTDAVCGLIYHPLRSHIMNRLFIDMRQSTGGVCIPKKEILRYLVTYKRENKMNLFGYIADQSPKYNNIHLWLDFMHQETPVFTGAERIIRKANNAVFYVDMQRPSRGRYICTFVPVTTEPDKMKEYELTRQFFKMLEESIRRDPAIYLWTHNRWKRTREEFEKEYKVENGHVIKRV